MKNLYRITDRKGKISKIGFYSEPEVRMAAKAGMRVFKILDDGKYSMEITQELTGLFKNPENKDSNV